MAAVVPQLQSGASLPRSGFAALLLAAFLSTTVPTRGAKIETIAISPTAAGVYKIGAGDILQVTVWKEPEMSVPSLVVRPDGKISLPLVKEVSAAALTPVELEHLISEKLALFVKDPDVSVLVKEIHSKKIYLVGAVHKAGPIALEYQMTVLQAIAEAGGLTEFAKTKRIYVLRSGRGGEQRAFFNYEAVIRGEHMDQNIELLPGDTIVVPH